MLFDGTDELERRSGVPTLGVLPWVDDVALDAEDSLAMQGPAPRPASTVPVTVDVAVVRFPHLANPTDLDPLAVEPGVGVRWVDHAAALGQPDLVVLPGSKATVADLAWLRAVGLDRAIAASTGHVLGICAGYQLLGRAVADPAGVEAPAGTVVESLGWLDVGTVWEPEKVTRRVTGAAGAAPVHGYEIHQGRTTAAEDVTPWLVLDGVPEGATATRATPAGPRGVFGTSLHGLFEADAFRAEFLLMASGGAWRPTGVRFTDAREAQLDRLGDLVEEHLDLAAIERLIATASTPTTRPSGEPVDEPRGKPRGFVHEFAVRSDP